jgi:C1A family cysteine protease
MWKLFIILTFGLLIFIKCRISTDNEKLLNDNEFLNNENFIESITLFNEYKNKFNKSYNEEENFIRFKIFENNLLKIYNLNKEIGKSYKMGITQFTDMSIEELSEKYLDFNIINKLGLKFLENYNNFEISKESFSPIDWRDKNIFLPVRNQEDCGACWAFATVGTIEAHRAIKFNKKMYLSPQQLVDCDSKEKGCKGGWPSIAYNYISTNGLVSEKNYPYQARNDNCINDIVKSHSEAKIESQFLRCEEDECLQNAFQYNLLKDGPVTVVIDAYNTNFFNYKSGIYDESCGEPNHAVILVGYGIDTTTNIPYWIIRNSWGPIWGMEGYGYVKFDTKNIFSCNLNRYGYQPKVLN